MKSFKIGFSHFIFHEIGRLSEMEYRVTTEYMIIISKREICSLNLQKFHGTKMSDYMVYNMIVGL